MGEAGSLDWDEERNLVGTENLRRKGIVGVEVSSAPGRQLTWAQVGLARLVASVALLGEVLGHPVGPGRRLGRFAGLP